MMRDIRTLLFKFVLALVFLRFVGNLPWMAAIAVAVLVPLNWQRSPKSVKVHFRPHQMYLTPHIGVMLGHLGLITDEDWKAHITKPLEIGTGWGCERLMKEGVHAVVLSTDPDDDDTVHWIGPNYYTQGVSLRVDLNFLKFPDNYWDWSPDFFIKPGSGGYHIGIRVKDKWWQENKERIGSLGIVKNEEREWQLGTTLLSLEILPAKVFWPFYHGWSQKLIDDAGKTAAEFGWTNTQAGNGEIGYFGEIYASKFAEVRISSLHSGC